MNIVIASQLIAIWYSSKIYEVPAIENLNIFGIFNVLFSLLWVHDNFCYTIFLFGSAVSRYFLPALDNIN